MRLSSLMNIWIIGFEIICELYHNPDISLWTIKALQHKARLKKSLIHFIDTLDICHHLMCLSWDWVCWAPSVTIVSNNVIRTIIIKYDIPFILEYYWDQNTRLKLFLIGFAVIPTGDEVQYCGWMFQENSLYTPHHCPSMASFPPMEARQWAGQATSWLAARPPNGRGGPRCGCLKATSRLLKSNTSKRKMGPKCLMNFLSCKNERFYTHPCWLYLIHTDCQAIPRK